MADSVLPSVASPLMCGRVALAGATSWEAIVDVGWVGTLTGPQGLVAVTIALSLLPTSSSLRA